MSLFKLTKDSDLDRGENGRGMSRVAGPEQTRTRVQTELRLFRGNGYGEVKRDISKGVNFFDFVVDPRTPETLIAAHLQAIILGVPGVNQSFLRFEIDPDEQEMIVGFDAIHESEDQRIRTVLNETITVALGDN